jgi:DHA1 family tetracycline resistance protein-like MFS transporter
VLSARQPGTGGIPPLPGYAAAALSLTAAAFGLFALREPARHVRAARAFGVGELRAACADGRIGILLALNFLNVFAFSCFEAMFIRFGLAEFPAVFDQPAQIEEATIDDVLRAAPIAGYYMFGIGIVSAVIQGGLIRRLLPRFGETRLAIAGPAILGVSLATIGGAPTWAVVIAGCFLMPFGFGLSNPSVNGLLSRAAPLEEQGAYLGLGQSMASLARVLGPPLAGLLFALMPRLPFFASAAVLFSGAGLAVLYRARYGSSFRHTEETAAPAAE